MTQALRCAKWNGSPEEWWELQLAIKRNCACETTRLCASHEMLVEDQRAIDGLLFARRIVQRLVVEELGPTGQRPTA
jgi:hypothetical protein